MPAKAKANTKKQVSDREAKLDEALDDTFPASDPIAVGGGTSTEPPGRSADHKAPRLDAYDVTAARKRKPSTGG